MPTSLTITVLSYGNTALSIQELKTMTDQTAQSVADTDK